MPPTTGTEPVDYAARMLNDLAHVLTANLPDMGAALSRILASFIEHSALLLLTGDELHNPLKMHGDKRIAQRVTAVELDAIRASISVGDLVRQSSTVAGRQRPVLACIAETGALLVLTDPGPGGYDEIIAAHWEIVALRIYQRARAPRRRT